MPEENDHEVHPMMNEKVISSNKYKSTEALNENDYIIQANYLIQNGFFPEDETISVNDVANRLKRIADENNKKIIE